MPRPPATLREQPWVREKLPALPDGPGVYFFKDRNGKVLYVGKAKSLRKRVASYFATGGHTLKTLRMLHQARDVEYLLVDSELEALMVENNCIKKYQPRYNVALKDDKSYPYLKLTLQERFPKAEFTRSLKEDGARYYGPLSAASIRTMLFLIQNVFQLRDCDWDMDKVHPRPCLQYQIRKCSGPCIRAVDDQVYGLQVQAARRFLDGEAEDVLDALEAEMRRAAAELAFERAALFRDQIVQVRKFLENQKVVNARKLDQDFLAVAYVGQRGVGALLTVRNGKLVGREQYPLRVPKDAVPEEVLGAFLTQYYARAALIPAEILLLQVPPDVESFEHWLKLKTGRTVRVKQPKRGEPRRLLQMAQRNAELYIEEQLRKEETATEITRQALSGLQQALQLNGLPRRIECYDISNLGASNKQQTATASRVVFVDGVPAKSEYRHYRIRGVEWQDDYAMMREALRRRLWHYRSSVLEGAGQAGPPADPQDERTVAQGVAEGGQHGLAVEALGDEPTGDPPARIDLLLIDGGKGHLGAALHVIGELGLQGEIEVAGLAKRNEELFVPWLSESVILPPGSPALYLVQRVRDEAHRFANRYRKVLNSRALAQSVLDTIPGVGPQRKAALLQHFGSIRKLKAASAAEIAAVPGMPAEVAERVAQALRAPELAERLGRQAVAGD